MVKSWILFTLALIITSCSQKAMYDNLQYSHVSSCEKLKSNHYEDCLGQYSDSYEDYTTKRHSTADK